MEVNLPSITSPEKAREIGRAVWYYHYREEATRLLQGDEFLVYMQEHSWLFKDAEDYQGIFRRGIQALDEGML